MHGGEALSLHVSWVDDDDDYDDDVDVIIGLKINKCMFNILVFLAELWL